MRLAPLLWAHYYQIYQKYTTALQGMRDVLEFLKDFLAQGSNSPLVDISTPEDVTHSMAILLCSIAMFLATNKDSSGTKLGLPDWVWNTRVRFTDILQPVEIAREYNRHAFLVNNGGFVTEGGNLALPTLAVRTHNESNKNFVQLGLHHFDPIGNKVSDGAFIRPTYSVNRRDENTVLPKRPAIFHRLFGVIGTLSKESFEVEVTSVLPTYVVRQDDPTKFIENKDYWPLKFLTLESQSLIQDIPDEVKDREFLAWLSGFNSSLKGSIFDTQWNSLITPSSKENPPWW